MSRPPQSEMLTISSKKNRADHRDSVAMVTREQAAARDGGIDRPITPIAGARPTSISDQRGFEIQEEAPLFAHNLTAIRLNSSLSRTPRPRPWLAISYRSSPTENPCRRGYF